MRLLIIYSTIDGYTFRGLRADRIDRVRADTKSSWPRSVWFPPPQLQACDRVVISASIRYGHHRPAIRISSTATRCGASSAPERLLLGQCGRPRAHKRQADTNPYLRKFLGQIRWKYQQIEVFGGKIEYPRYRLLRPQHDPPDHVDHRRPHRPALGHRLHRLDAGRDLCTTAGPGLMSPRSRRQLASGDSSNPGGSLEKIAAIRIWNRRAGRCGGWTTTTTTSWWSCLRAATRPKRPPHAFGRTGIKQTYWVEAAGDSGTPVMPSRPRGRGD